MKLDSPRRFSRSEFTLNPQRFTKTTRKILIASRFLLSTILTSLQRQSDSLTPNSVLAYLSCDEAALALGGRTLVGGCLEGWTAFFAVCHANCGGGDILGDAGEEW